MTTKQRFEHILAWFAVNMPVAESELHYESPFQLLIAVMLSAQCTDARVNKVTPVLFKEYGTPQKLASARQEDIERIIYSCGFYHNKAKNLIACSRDFVEKYDGEVPSTLDKLQTLAGVGRKTANVVYSLWFKGDAIAVDTHVFRVSNRLAIATGKTPFEVEEKLMKAYNQQDWSKLHYMLVLFGRYKCKAIKPECETCKLREFCKHYKSTLKQI